MLRSLALLSLISFLSPSGFATTYYVSMGGYGSTSYLDSAGLYHVYAGMTGPGATVCSTNSTDLCDSCSKLATQPITNYGTGFACNKSEINTDLVFQIQLQSDQPSAYPVGPCQNVIGIPNGSTTDSLLTSTVPSYSANAPKQTVTATFKWSDICSKSNGADSSCHKSFNTSWEFAFISACGGGISSKIQEQGVRVQFHYRYVDASPAMTFNAANPCNGNTASGYENACHFKLFPGDGKAYVTDLISNNSSGYIVPNLNVGATGTTSDDSGMSYSAVRFFYAEGANNFAAITSANGKDVPVTGITANDPRVDGLQNGTTYSMMMANVDQAGNVTYFSSDAGALGVDQQVTPQPVFGMLDGKSCFVATAAYGSPMADQVENLRQFRNHFLLKTSAGQKFVRFYYAHSPEWAAVIAKSEFLRATARTLLAPVVSLSEYSLHHQLGPAAGSFLFALGLFISFVIVIAIMGFLGFASYWSVARVRALRN